MKERQAQEIRLVGWCNTVWCMIFFCMVASKKVSFIYLLQDKKKIEKTQWIKGTITYSARLVIAHLVPSLYIPAKRFTTCYGTLTLEGGREKDGSRGTLQSGRHHGRHPKARSDKTQSDTGEKYLQIRPWSKNHWKKVVENEQLHGCCIDPKVNKSHKTCNAMHSPAPRHPARNTFSIQQITEWPSSKNQKSPGMPKQNEDTVHPHVTSTPSIWAISTSHSHPHYGNRILPELKLDWDTKATVSNIIINIYQHLSNVQPSMKSISNVRSSSSK